MPAGLKGFQVGNTIGIRRYCNKSHDTALTGRDKSGNCKECRRAACRNNYRIHNDNCRNSRYKAQFGITLADYNAMLTNQNYACYGCERKESQFNIRLAVDHCHRSGRVRALLCADCNNVLGRSHDSVEVLKRLTKLLEKTQ